MAESACHARDTALKNDPCPKVRGKSWIAYYRDNVWAAPSVCAVEGCENTVENGGTKHFEGAHVFVGSQMYIVPTCSCHNPGSASCCFNQVPHHELQFLHAGGEQEDIICKTQ